MDTKAETVRVVLRNVPGLGRTLAQPSSVLTGVGLGEGGRPAAGPAVVIYQRGVPVEVPPADAAVLLGMKKPMALEGGGVVEVNYFEVVTEQDAFASLTPDQAMQAMLKLQARQHGISEEAMKAVVAETALEMEVPEDAGADDGAVTAESLPSAARRRGRPRTANGSTG